MHCDAHCYGKSLEDTGMLLCIYSCLEQEWIECPSFSNLALVVQPHQVSTYLSNKGHLTLSNCLCTLGMQVQCFVLFFQAKEFKSGL